MNDEKFFDNIRFLVENLDEGQENSRWAVIFDAIVEGADSESISEVSLGNVSRLLLDSLHACSFEDRRTAVVIAEFYARFAEVSRCELWGEYSWNPLVVTPRIPYVFQKFPYVKVPSTALDWVLSPLRVRNAPECHYIDTIPDDTARLALDTGDWKFLSVLIKMGFWNGIKDCEQHSKYWFRFLTREADLHIRNVVGGDQAEVACLFWCGRRQILWNELQENGSRMQRECGRGFQRILLLLLMIMPSFFSTEPMAEEFAGCKKMFLEMVPDPLVSEDELNEFLPLLSAFITGVLIVFVTQFGRYKYTKVAWVNECVKLLGQPYIPLRYKPRSLVHLSRCTVRNALVQNKSHALPSLVEQLTIPRSLKDFLLGMPEFTTKGVRGLREQEEYY